MMRRHAAWPAAMLALLLCSGCAMFGAPPQQTPAAPARAPVEAPRSAEQEQRSATLGVTVEIEAPGTLKALLERHLDLVRLGGMTRDDIDDTEWSRLIDATPAQVAELLQTEGYFTPQVMLERAPGRAAGQPDVVRVRVEPGTRAHVSRITIEAEGELERGAAAGDRHAVDTLDFLRRTWELPMGADFRNGDWRDAKANALARLRGAGYASAAWTGTGAEVDVARNEVRLFLVVDSGPLFRYGRLDIEGLVAHDAETVRNLVAARRGAPVTETLILDFQDRLAKSGLFESVNVTLDPDPAQAAEARIVARLRESPLQVYTIAVGFSSNNGPRATVEHAWRRVFGRAASVRNKAEWGGQRQAWEGELSSHPGEGLYRNLIGGAIENLESDSDTVLSQRLRIGRTQDTQRFERLYFVEAERSQRRALNDVRTDAFALSLNYHGVWRQLDSVILPTEGFTFAGQAGVGRSH
ncbi:MAG: outer membrane protein assembly factor, partial [Rubrivivax sp.]|nr:outer membrane protein assembly factor [Rubrivivax sp.]